MTIGVGLIGTGGIGRRHRRAWNALAGARDYCDTRVVATSGRTTGAPSSDGALRYANWQQLVDDPAVAIVDICAPDEHHEEMLVYAADAGKHVLCEKPLALAPNSDSVVSGSASIAACFVYRHLPAAGLAKSIIAEGALGRVLEVRADYLQGWGLSAPEGSWRLQPGRIGVVGDLGTHLMDLSAYLVPAFEATTVSSASKGDPRLRANWNVVGAGDLSGRFAASRVAAGYGNHLRLEVFGDQGALCLTAESPNEITLTSLGARGAREVVRIEEGRDRSFLENWWAPGIELGWNDQFVHQVADMVDLYLGRGVVESASLADGLRADRWMYDVLASMTGCDS